MRVHPPKDGEGTLEEYGSCWQHHKKLQRARRVSWMAFYQFKKYMSALSKTHLDYYQTRQLPGCSKYTKLGEMKRLLDCLP